MRTIGIVTVARSDFGLFRPILHEAQRRNGLRPRLYVAGSHLSPAHGLTVKEIEAEGWPIAARVETVGSDTPRGIATSMAAALAGFGACWDHTQPDALLVLGDRFETFCAVAAAQPFRLPIVHLHGGEATEGLYDEAFRHAVTKMSHLHLVSTNWAAQRVAALGEEGWRIRVVGAPGLDGIVDFKPVPRAGAAFLPPGKFLMVVYHPVTLDGKPAKGTLAISQAIRRIGLSALWIGPGCDMGWSFIEGNADRPEGSVYVHHMPRAQFWTAMAYAECMVGNSSAGIIEAASFGLPVVDVGDRQRGRMVGQNVFHVRAETEAIVEAIRGSIQPAYRKFVDAAMGAGLSRWRNPYDPFGDGRASARICDALEALEINDHLLKKRLELNDAQGDA